MLPKISIIVPVYNTENYLDQCLNSLVNQTLHEIQIIVINDGSTDNSLDIISKYAENDSRINIINQDNQGSGSARKAGLNCAIGEYVIVCDSDDWVEPNMYEELFNKAIENDADIVSCDSIIEYPDYSQFSSSHLKSETQSQLIKEVLSGSNNSSCNKLVKLSIIHDNGINYVDGINLGEDALFLYKLLPHIKVINFVPKAFYHYRRSKNSGSCTGSMNMRKALQLWQVYDWLKSNYGKEFKVYKHIQAVNVAFAILRAYDMDSLLLRSFLSNNITYRNFTSKASILKQILIFSAKFLPPMTVKGFYKMLYPYVYR